jgi:cephalosporin hydroxylase
MKRLEVDFDTGDVRTTDEAGHRTVGIGTTAGFEAISWAWLRSGWDTKYVYGFTWLGRPVIQLPDDLVRLQEVVHGLRPDVIIETGVAHGGLTVFLAGLCRLLGRGRVISIDIDIRPPNRQAIEAHPLADLITLVEGSSVDPATVATVEAHLGAGETVMVILDSRHTRDHVLSELRSYGPMVSVGYYIVAMDGIMEQLVGAPRSSDDWSWNNPRQAARDFVAGDSRFILHEPVPSFNEGLPTARVTYSPDAFVKRIS